MSRKLIASFIACYAIAFAFGALTAVRWPSIMLVVSWLVKDQLAEGVATVNWRELGITHGGPYLIAAICFYASACLISTRAAAPCCGMSAASLSASRSSTS